RTQCREIGEKREAVQGVYEHNVKIVKDIFEEFRDYANALRDQCAKRATTKEETNRCEQGYAGFMKRVLTDYANDLEKESAERDSRLKFLDELEKKCQAASVKPAPSVSGGGKGLKTIKVIRYQSKFLPVESLHKFTGTAKEECDAEEHWHANAGVVRATDGTMAPDPGGCGYGKTKGNPAIDLE
ncbi:MAG: hypothetical protein HY984_02270, partial [Candidatus Magasanikbacteria bacterium]|nr:hypothetical protein [Candidatus Magasanikbacteria bacterium]